MNNDPIYFSRQLVKGRIAETLFEQMLRDAGGFTILAFGYESVLPELAHRQQDIQAKETMEIIRRAPDFAVIDNNTHEVHLIEVKYMSNRNGWVLPAATRMHDSWKPAYLFIASPDGFFFDKASRIIERGGIIDKLSLSQLKIPDELQTKYIALLNRFIPPNTELNSAENGD
ncbi:MAG: hypothetical protein Q7S36_03125 [Candidatus Liptonbacteria bacterium]|nr:hypothetical protein [Candidatus Liptonbacteria bacterium]